MGLTWKIFSPTPKLPLVLEGAKQGAKRGLNPPHLAPAKPPDPPSVCPDCFKHFKVMLEKVKSQKSWTGWTALEKEVDSLKKEVESLKNELQFLRHEVGAFDRLMNTDPRYEVVIVVTSGCKPLNAHRSILISRLDKLTNYVITAEKFKKDSRHHNEPTVDLKVPMHPVSFRAFIQFLYTAELKHEVLDFHAHDLMRAGCAWDIQLLVRKCEDFIVKHMTEENTIRCLELATECESMAIKEAAVKQIPSNPQAFVEREDYNALRKDKKTNKQLPLAEAFHYIILDYASGEKKEEKASVAKGSDPGSDPTINSGLPRDRYSVETSFRSLGTCRCPMHPFAHSAAPGFEYSYGVHAHAATALPSTVNFVDPPTSSTPDN